MNLLENKFLVRNFRFKQVYFWILKNPDLKMTLKVCADGRRARVDSCKGFWSSLDISALREVPAPSLLVILSIPVWVRR